VVTPENPFFVLVSSSVPRNASFCIQWWIEIASVWTRNGAHIIGCCSLLLH